MRIAGGLQFPVAGTIFTPVQGVVMKAGKNCFPGRRRIALQAVLLGLFFSVSPDLRSESHRESEAEGLSVAERNRRVMLTAAAGIGAVTAWGIWQWDYFSTTPHASSEGWFGRNTGSGGADKLGHVYTCYAASHGFAYLYEQWSFERQEAALYGALTSLAIFGAMEVGDSFSSYGLSGEDMAANLVGCAAGYLLYTRPGLAEKIDLRWAPGLSPNKADFTTDYENSKYLIALKLNGFRFAQQNLLKHIELHAGYYTRGFAERTESNNRYAYAGLGLNLTDLLFRNGYEKAATFLRYVQPPLTSVNSQHKL